MGPLTPQRVKQRRSTRASAGDKMRSASSPRGHDIFEAPRRDHVTRGMASWLVDPSRQIFMPHSRQSHPLIPRVGDQDAMTRRGPRRWPFGQCVGGISVMLPSGFARNCTLGY
jgi:hypothetical protein